MVVRDGNADELTKRSESEDGVALAFVSSTPVMSHDNDLLVYVEIATAFSMPGSMLVLRPNSEPVSNMPGAPAAVTYGNRVTCSDCLTALRP